MVYYVRIIYRIHPNIALDMKCEVDVEASSIEEAQASAEAYFFAKNRRSYIMSITTVEGEMPCYNSPA